jgi:hypothetical protein
MSAETDKKVATSDQKVGTDSWETAQKYAGLIGEVPSSITSAIRTLRAGTIDGTAQSMRNAEFALSRLLKTDTLSVPAYFAAKAFHPDQIKEGHLPTCAEFIKILGHDIFASIVGVTYLYRKIRKMCDEKQWEQLAGDMHLQMHIGSHLGYAIPAIGPGVGMLAGAMRFLGIALFLSHDLKGYRGYRRELTESEEQYNISHEETRWGCNHLQVGASLLQHLGFGLQFARGLSYGLDPTNAITEEKGGEEVHRWQMTHVWLEALRTTGQAPGITLKGRYYPEKEPLDRLVRTVSRAVATHPGNWLDRVKEDLTSLGHPVSEPDPIEAALV